MVVARERLEDCDHKGSDLRAAGRESLEGTSERDEHGRSDNPGGNESMKFEKFAKMTYEEGMKFHHRDEETGEMCKGAVYAILQIDDVTTYECEFHGLLNQSEVEEEKEPDIDAENERRREYNKKHFDSGDSD